MVMEILRFRGRVTECWKDGKGFKMLTNRDPVGNGRFSGRLPPLVVAVVFFLLPTAIRSSASEWEWMNPVPQGNHLMAAVDGTGVAVAVGDLGSIVASSDGLTWHVVHFDPEYWLWDVTWGNGKFVAVGGADDPENWEGVPGIGVVLSSDDGFHWTESHQVEYRTLEAVSWSGAVFVAVGKGSLALTSADGLSWSEHQLGSGFGHLWDLEWTGSEFVAVGVENAIDGGNSIFFSSDGMTWRRHTFEAGFQPFAIVFNGLRYVAVGGLWPGQPHIAVSDDGLTWDRVSWEVAGAFRDVVFANDRFVAVGGLGLLATSHDGLTWSLHDRISSFDIFGIEWNGNDFLAVGQDGLMLHSNDGASWNQIGSNSLDLHESTAFSKIVRGRSTWVGVGGRGVIITSNNGFEWTEQPSPAPSSLYSVIWVGTSFWAVGYNIILKSGDGAFWEPALIDPDVILHDIAWNGSLYVAVGESTSSGDDRATIVSSPDGLSWDTQSFEEPGPLYAVEWAGDEFVAVGEQGMYLTSGDGLSWQQDDLHGLITLEDLAWNGDRLLAIGYGPEDAAVLLIRKENNTWEDRTPPGINGGRFNDIVWTGSEFVAIGWSFEDLVFTSPDGLNWSSESTDTWIGIEAVGGDGAQIFAFGYGGDAIRRDLRPPAPRRPTNRVRPLVNKESAKTRVRPPLSIEKK
jgi:hypothetical protein